jgi:3-oxoacyl-[acyl-carrier-protein] synthase II
MTAEIVVTGIGVVTPIGSGVNAYWEALLRGRGARPHPVTRGRELLDNQVFYRIADGQPPPADAPASRTTQYGLQATAMALAEAGLTREHLAGLRVGVILGTGMGEYDLVEELRERGGSKPSVEPQFPLSAVAASVARAYGFTGPNHSVSTACAAGSYAVSLARDAIAAGRADVMITGGAEVFSRVGQGCFWRLGALDPEVCRPFDADRKGTVFGEGAGILVLESAPSAAARGWRRPLATVRGAGWSCDGHHATAPEPSGFHIELAARRALEDAALGPDDIDCVVPHGTGTALNDAVESRTLERLFGGRLRDVKVTALKSHIGHSGGAAGALSCLTAALILDRQCVPPTANITAVDPACALRIHTDGPVYGEVRNVLVNAYAFGGNNVSVILGKAERTTERA